MSNQSDETKMLMRELTELFVRARKAGVRPRFFAEMLIEFGKGGLRACDEQQEKDRGSLQ